MSQPPVAPAAPVAPTDPDAGKGLGIAGLVIDFFIAPLGLILSIVAKSMSRKAGVSNTPATVGIVLGIIFTVVGIIVGIIFALSIGALASECATLGAGVHHVGDATYTCGS